MKSVAILLLLALIALLACKTSGPGSSPTPLPAPKPEPQPPVQSVHPPPAKPATPPPVDVVAERQRLLETDLAFSRASEQRGAAQAFYEFLTPDALSLQGGELPIRGRDAIKIQITTNLRGSLRSEEHTSELQSPCNLV